MNRTKNHQLNIIQRERQVILKYFFMEKEDVWYCSSKRQNLVSKSQHLSFKVGFCCWLMSIYTLGNGICGTASIKSVVLLTRFNDLLLIFVQERSHGIKLTNSIFQKRTYIISLLCQKLPFQLLVNMLMHVNNLNELGLIVKASL